MYTVLVRMHRPHVLTQAQDEVHLFDSFATDKPFVIFRTISSTPTSEWLSWCAVLWSTSVGLTIPPRSDYHNSLLNHLVTTVLGVHPCAYEQWVTEEHDDTEDDYTYSYSDDGYPTDMGRRFGPFVAGSLPANPIRELRLNEMPVDLPMDMPSDLPPLPEGVMLDSVPDFYRAKLQDDNQMYYDDMFDPQQPPVDLLDDDDFVIEEISLWDSLRDASAWGVMLFLVLVAACVLVWTAFISTCCSMRYGAHMVSLWRLRNRFYTPTTSQQHGGAAAVCGERSDRGGP